MVTPTRAPFSCVAFLVSCSMLATAQLTKPATSVGSDLVSQLAKQLSITPQQATGGAGAIFGVAKSRLSAADFNKVASFVPGIDKMLQAAPTKTGSSPLTSLESMVPGQAKGLASLGSSFQNLGLSPSMVGKFVPVMQKYLSAKGGAGIASLFAGALK